MAHSEDSSSLIPTVLLLIAAAAGFVLSNSQLADTYTTIFNTKINFAVGDYKLFNKSFLLFINDGLMAIFFLFVGLELKRELVVGELSDLKKASLPIVAAIGGMMVPAIIYYTFNTSGDPSNGWGIPMATDIAFALGVLTVLGSRVPMTLKIMLAAIAIVDDLGAILVIALFYTSEIGVSYLGLAAAMFALLVVMNQMGIQKLSLYLFIGLPLWYFMLKSGVHATIAGVMLAFTIPLAPKKASKAKLISDIFNNEASPLDSPAVFLEKSLFKWVGLLIIPLFAFANSGVSLGAISFGSISMGVILGLVLGKPLGIAGLSWLANKTGLASLPEGMSWTHLVGLGSLAGIGFTMSLFIGSLAFNNPNSYDEAKVAILIGSSISAVLGLMILLSANKKSKT